MSQGGPDPQDSWDHALSTAGCGLPSPGAAPLKVKGPRVPSTGLLRSFSLNFGEIEGLRHSQLHSPGGDGHLSPLSFLTLAHQDSKPEVRLQARTKVTLSASSTYWERKLSPRRGFIRCLVSCSCLSCWRPLSTPQSLPGNGVSRRRLGVLPTWGGCWHVTWPLGVLLTQLLHPPESGTSQCGPHTRGCGALCCDGEAITPEM